MKHHHALIGLLLMTLTLMVGSPDALAQEGMRAQRDDAKVVQSRYLRAALDEDGSGRMETAIVRYRNPKGVELDLIAAIHVGEKAYYEALNKHFARYDSLLYEMIKPQGARMATPDEMRRRPVGFLGGMQQGLGRAMELDYQLHYVDYTAANFVHADLTVEQFIEAQDERDESLTKLMIQSSLTSSFSADAISQRDSMALMGAMLSQKDRLRNVRLIFARTLARGAMFEAMDGLNDSAIITDRNDAAIRVMGEKILDGDRRIGIFYGAAHLPHMHEVLTEDFGFEHVGTEWVTAWHIPAPGEAEAEKPEPAAEREREPAAEREREPEAETTQPADPVEAE